jgi:diadenosine tetraphosphate (Ap4A) HIT family hydrolase
MRTRNSVLGVVLLVGLLAASYYQLTHSHGTTHLANYSPECAFCRIIHGDIPSYKVIETEHAWVQLDRAPLSDGHTLVVPKFHAEKLHELPERYVVEVAGLVQRVAMALSGGSGGAVDYNVLQNNGRLAGQSVPHVHFHVIPKTNLGDGLIKLGMGDEPADGKRHNVTRVPFRPTDQQLRDRAAQLASRLRSL